MKSLKLIPRYGLGNRLMAVASGIRLVTIEKFDELRVCWYPSGDLDIRITDLMEGPYITEEGEESESVYVNYIGLPQDARVPVLPKVTVEAYNPFTCEGDITPPKTINRQLGNALRTLKFKINPTLDVAGRIGIHCRRTDFPYVVPRMSAADTDAHHRRIDRLFADAVAEQFPTEPLFLATDSAETDEHFKRKFGDRLVSSPKQHYPVWCHRPQATVEEGVVDMLLLSRCQKIVADSFSTFSTVAGWLGDIEKLIWQRPKAPR